MADRKVAVEELKRASLVMRVRAIGVVSSRTPTTSNMSFVAVGEPTLFDSLARLVPKDLQAAYYRVLAHTRTLSPDEALYSAQKLAPDWSSIVCPIMS